MVATLDALAPAAAPGAPGAGGGRRNRPGAARYLLRYTGRRNRPGAARYLLRYTGRRNRLRAARYLRCAADTITRWEGVAREHA